MDLVNIGIGTAGLVGLLGYMVVFIGLILLMLVVMLVSKFMISQDKKAAAAAAAAAPAAAEVVKAAPAPAAKPAPGTAGDIKLYDTDPKDAAMIMAIVADTLGKPLNELRFKSIREVK